MGSGASACKQFYVEGVGLGETEARCKHQAVDAADGHDYADTADETIKFKAGQKSSVTGGADCRVRERGAAAEMGGTKGATGRRSWTTGGGLLQAAPAVSSESSAGGGHPALVAHESHMRWNARFWSFAKTSQSQ